MSKPLVSIIAPVYGVEDYVGRAIESIQKQTYQNWELFAVDDGSKDNSGAICDAYAQRDARITVIHKENGGAPSARNLAIDQAKGKYFYFMDPDDFAEPDMLTDMVRAAEANNAQLVVAGYYIDTYYSDTEKYTQEQGVAGKVYASQQEFREDAYRLFDQNLLYTPWNKLFLADYIRDNKIYFPNTFWDDFPFNLTVLYDVERVVVIPGKYYHFVRQRAESETAKYRSNMYEKREEEHGWMCAVYEHWGIDDANSREFLARRYIERLIGCVENITNKNCTLSRKEKIAEIKAMLQNEKVAPLLKTMVPKSSYMKLMLVPMKMHSAGLTYLEGSVISSVKTSNVKLFAKLKSKR